MADPISLKALVHAIVSAVGEAQYQVERAQVTNLSRFFDENQRPKLMTMRLPSSNPKAPPGEEQLFGVPLLTLAPQTQLRIAQARFEFEVDLGELGDVEALSSGSVIDGFEAHTQVLGVNHAPRLLGPRRRPAQVTIKLEAVDHVEGVARVLGELNKMHGELAKVAAPTTTVADTGPRP